LVVMISIVLFDGSLWGAWFAEIFYLEICSYDSEVSVEYCDTHHCLSMRLVIQWEICPGNNWNQFYFIFLITVLISQRIAKNGFGQLVLSKVWKSKSVWNFTHIRYLALLRHCHNGRVYLLFCKKLCESLNWLQLVSLKLLD